MKFAIIFLFSFFLAACGGGDDQQDLNWNYASRITSENTSLTLNGDIEVFHISHRAELIAIRYLPSNQFGVKVSLTQSDWLLIVDETKIAILNSILGYAISTSSNYSEAISKFYVESQIASLQTEPQVLAVADLVINAFFYSPLK